MRQTFRSFGAEVPSGNGPDCKTELQIETEGIPVKLRPVIPGAEAEAVRKADTKYLVLLYAGELYEKGTLQACVSALESHAGAAEAAVPETEADSKRASTRKRAKQTRLLHTDREQEILQSPGFFGGTVFCSRAAGEVLSRTEAGNLSGGTEPAVFREFLAIRVMERLQTLLYVSGHYFYSGHPLFLQGGFCAELADASWYGHVMDACLALLREEDPQGRGCSVLRQAQVLQIIRVLYSKNMNASDKKAFTEETLPAFHEKVRLALGGISPILLDRWQPLHVDRRMSFYQLAALIEARGSLAGIPFPAILMLTEYEKGCLHLDLGIAPFLASSWFEILAGEEPVSWRTGSCSPGIRFFGKELEFRVVSADIPVPAERGSFRIRFFVKNDGSRIQLPIVTQGYQSRISSMVQGSYWCFGRHMLHFRSDKNTGEGRMHTALAVDRAGRLRRMLQEISVLARMPFGKDRSREMFLMRLRYWYAWPSWHKKNIWLTFDKLYKGGDCGEYFYRYMLTRTKEGIMPVYLINPDSPDYGRMKEEGLHPTAKGTLDQKLMFLYARMIFATHSNVPEFNGFNRWKIHYIQDRLAAVNTCIQHGLSVQDLTLDSNRLVNNNKRYYCASPCEVRNLSGPGYDYPPDVLRLTGIPRYDGLISRPQKQILITPTWRSYIAMPAVMGAARPYNPEFKETAYFRIYESLITNEKLISCARECGYQIIYLLHPVTSAQLPDYTAGSQVRLISGAETDYEALLTESALMVTDYSGVQFDFAYMRKPVLYYHHPELPPHFRDGGFDYETQGFGEICTSEETLVEALCRAMRRDCRLEPGWRERQDAFFAFDDHENCRRIFEDAYAYQEEKHRCS